MLFLVLPFLLVPWLILVCKSGDRNNSRSQGGPVQSDGIQSNKSKKSTASSNKSIMSPKSDTAKESVSE
ncbi:hypothetical protein PRIPAC_80539 [Pristionchus pacificus]|nr:hypothetical protein PRIPAC_80539 [Pristionchus pacificus]